MSNTKYTYAVARIRALETKLFNQAVIDQLIGCATEEECIQLLEEKGWGDQERGREDLGDYPGDGRRYVGIRCAVLPQSFP